MNQSKSQQDELAEIIFQMVQMDITPEAAHTKLQSLLDRAVLSELENLSHSEGSVHIKAEKVSYQPANHDPIHTWPVID